MNLRRTTISVRISGGLGNQLFGLAAAIHLRDVVGVPVALDHQSYRHQSSDTDTRHFELDELPHGFKTFRGRGNSSRIRALPRALKRRIITRGARVILFNDAVAEARATDDSTPTARALIELTQHEPPYWRSPNPPPFQSGDTAVCAQVSYPSRVPAGDRCALFRGAFEAW